jgi:hypothetical protein
MPECLAPSSSHPDATCKGRHVDGGGCGWGTEPRAVARCQRVQSVWVAREGCVVGVGCREGAVGVGAGEQGEGRSEARARPGRAPAPGIPPIGPSLACCALVPGGSWIIHTNPTQSQSQIVGMQIGKTPRKCVTNRMITDEPRGEVSHGHISFLKSPTGAKANLVSHGWHKLHVTWPRN